jgi:hypothetical protein
MQLLNIDMSSRLGVAEKNTLVLLDHPFFNSIDKEAVASMVAPAPFIPKERELMENRSMPENTAFTGRQDVFAALRGLRENSCMQPAGQPAALPPPIIT